MLLEVRILPLRFSMRAVAGPMSYLWLTSLRDGTGNKLERQLGPLSAFPTVPGNAGRLAARTGRSPVWLRRRLWEPKIGGSNPSVPNLLFGGHACRVGRNCGQVKLAADFGSVASIG
jgi:hypothetical protein